MKKDELQNRIKDGLFEAAPDMWEDVLCRVQQKTQNATVVPMKKSRRRNAGKTAAFCATLTAACLALFFFFGNSSRDIYVVLSVNPQIEIVLDDSYEVKKVKALNDDGKQILQGLSVKKGMPVDELMDEMVDEMQEKNFLHDGSGMLFAVYAPQSEQGETLICQMNEMVEQELKEHDLQDVVTAFVETEKEMVEHAREILEEKLEESGQDTAMELSEFLRKCSERGVCDVKVANESPKQEILERLSEEAEQEKPGKAKKATLSKENKDKIKMSMMKQEEKSEEEDDALKTETEATDPEPPVETPQVPVSTPEVTPEPQLPPQSETSPSDNEGDSDKADNENNGNNGNGNNGNSNNGNGNGNNGNGNNGNNGNGNNENNGYESSGNSNAGSKANSSDKKEKKNK